MRQEEPMDLWVYEREAFDAGIKLVCGVDEAGRGPLAGPVCAAAVMLPPGLEIPGLNDSKKLTDKKRRELYVRKRTGDRRDQYFTGDVSCHGARHADSFPAAAACAD